MTRSPVHSIMEQLSLPLGLPADWAQDPPQSAPTPAGAADPAAAFVRAFRRMGIKQALPDFRVEYHAYAGLRSTVRLRDNQVRVRLSDLLAESPPIVLEALAEILLAKLFRRPASREARECYLAYVFKESTRRRIEEARRERGGKRQRPARGWVFNLDEIFEDLNRRFFKGKLPAVRLGWSAQLSRTILGHYDAAHHTITISRLLDSPRSARYLVEYLMFHEMLHIKYPVERRGHRRVVHPRQFREEEKRFPKYELARRRLRLMSGRME
ncbi:MAG: hypothetical protein DMG25_11445 [Acidobacteria bacterium]|nr:MAG: hypothetical protein DMG25_11445 [Acidobacteriota bacterium]